MKFSIIIPVYNTESYIERTYHSIVQQNFNELEIIFIDDGSTDNSLQIIQDIAARDERVLVKHQANQDVSAARNYGMTLATGDYICFLDSDDEYQGDYFIEINQILENNPVDLIIYGMTHDKEIISRGFENCVGGGRVQRRLITHLDKIHDKYNIYSSCTKVIKRSLIQQTGAQFPHQKIGEDALFMFQLYDIVDSYILIDKNYYYYRNRVDSAMHTPKDEVRLLEELVMFHYLDQLFIQHNENSMLPQKNAVHMIF